MELMGRTIADLVGCLPLVGSIKKTVRFWLNKCAFPGVTIDANTPLYRDLKDTYNFGRNVRLQNCRLTGYVSMGDYSYANDSNFGATKNAPITIGKFCSIAGGCTFLTEDHPLELLSTGDLTPIFGETPRGESQPITIGNDVWIGTKSTILKGVTVGDGAVVGAGSVVTKDVAPYSIVAGVPAKPIGRRPKIRDNWWDWEIGTIRANRRLFFNKE